MKFLVEKRLNYNDKKISILDKYLISFQGFISFKSLIFQTILKFIYEHKFHLQACNFNRHNLSMDRILFYNKEFSKDLMLFSQGIICLPLRVLAHINVLVRIIQWTLHKDILLSLTIFMNFKNSYSYRINYFIC